MKNGISFFGMVALVATSCAGVADNRLPSEAETLLRGAASIELFALDPNPLTASAGGSQLHGYGITGQATLSDGKQLAELVLRGIRESDGRVAACFNPRHGLRIEH